MEERQRKEGRERGRDSRAHRNTTDNSEDWGTSEKELSGKGNRCSVEGGGVSWQAQEYTLQSQEGQSFLVPAVFSREPF